MKTMKFGKGQPVRRSEDLRFITGAGQFATDYRADGAVHAVFVRSPHAHARFTVRNKDAVRQIKGVLLVWTADDVSDIGIVPCQALIKGSDGQAVRQTEYAVLARGVVRHVGDAVAMVVARTLHAARDAAEALDISYEAEPAAVGIERAIADGAPLVWPDIGSNVCFEAEIGDKARTDAAFAKADRVVSLRVVNNRLVANYMEPRVCTAEYDAPTKSYRLTLGSQGSHGLRNTLARMMSLDPRKIRVVTPDVGGGFGNKAFTYREYALLARAARVLKKPVAWTQERGEHFLSCAHGRDNVSVAEMALSRGGRFLAMRVDVLADMGAYLSQYAPYIPFLGGTMASGVYDIPAAHFRVRGVYTHTVPVDAYRGAGRPEAAYLIERLVDRIALETGRAPDAVRALNFIKPKSMPYKTPVNRTYDSGDFAGHMRRAMEAAGWATFKTRAAAARRKGLLRGIGMSSYIEACGGGSAEPAYVTLDTDGRITVKIGTQSTGQGHETAYAQLVSEYLDVPLSQIVVRQGDTLDTPTGGGTGGSRSIPVGGAAVDIAARALADNVRTLAADRLEAATTDLEIAGGRVTVAGTDRSLTLQEIARGAGDQIDLLSTTGTFAPPEATYPNGTHICEVEIDRETGTTRIANYVIVDDFGVTLNPMLLAGQVHGGAAQGIGQAMIERTVFDADGQLVTASFNDYAMPRADDFPHFAFETRNVPCSTNLLGVKGAGEAGTIGATPAVVNAIVDALHRAGGRIDVDMPLTSEVVFNALSQARSAMR